MRCSLGSFCADRQSQQGHATGSQNLSAVKRHLFSPDRCKEPEGQAHLKSCWLHPKLLIQSFQVSLGPLDKLVYIVQTNPIFGSERFWQPLKHTEILGLSEVLHVTLIMQSSPTFWNTSFLLVCIEGNHRENPCKLSTESQKIGREELRVYYQTHKLYVFRHWRFITQTKPKQADLQLSLPSLLSTWMA